MDDWLIWDGPLVMELISGPELIKLAWQLVQDWWVSVLVGAWATWVTFRKC